MSSIPFDDSDIIGWTPEYLNLRRAADLQALVKRMELQFPGIDAEARPEGRRGKKNFDKAEHVALLLAKRAAVVAAQGGNGSAAANTSAAEGFILYGAVQFQQTDGGSWERAVITGLGGEYLEPFCRAESERGFPLLSALATLHRPRPRLRPRLRHQHRLWLRPLLYSLAAIRL